ncbi:hypothetical protein BCON_0162g00070 [Botryotinia convoluta]|uniref:Nudix hydrolase domain-containing protein n=1 Tax=Botryotinia convoluta TaxID=54673 RepID=A0A4Z1HY83_9HELO|nr:hypothetical protein BCON_0162g00070 [Botryotinia convoluta]
MSTPTPTPPHPRIGVGIFLLHPAHPLSTPASPIFLMGQRLGSHGAGMWAHPGGHLEFGEELEECAIREVEEETGLCLRREDVRFLTATNSVMEGDGKEGRKERKHYVTIWMMGRWDGKGEGPRNLEPEKCAGWEWVRWEDMKGNGEESGERKLFQPVSDLLRTRGEVLPPNFE